jgi:hypothetical protein
MKILSKWFLCLLPICAMVLAGCGGEKTPELPTPKGFAPKMENASTFLPPGVGDGATAPGATATGAAGGASTAPVTGAPGTATPGTATPGTK